MTQAGKTSQPLRSDSRLPDLDAFRAGDFEETLESTRKLSALISTSTEAAFAHITALSDLLDENELRKHPIMLEDPVAVTLFTEAVTAELDSAVEQIRNLYAIGEKLIAIVAALVELAGEKNSPEELINPRQQAR